MTLCSCYPRKGSSKQRREVVKASIHGVCVQDMLFMASWIMDEKHMVSEALQYRFPWFWQHPLGPTASASTLDRWCLLLRIGCVQEELFIQIFGICIWHVKHFFFSSHQHERAVPLLIHWVCTSMTGKPASHTYSVHKGGMTCLMFVTMHYFPSQSLTACHRFVPVLW